MAPIKLAVVGAGPSAFYVASRLLSRLPSTGNRALRVDLYDRLWAPYGLVRYGVAPDHPEVKNCTSKFIETSKDARLRFFGNVNVETTASPISHALSMPLKALLPYYTHILFASGCTVPILHPALPPSRYCTPALSLVHWYTMHPSNPDPPPLERISHLTLIGQGNVSLDIARMLLTPPDNLVKFDYEIPTSVLDLLRKSSVRHVSIVGRRGPLQAAFTTKELREMMNLPDASMVPLDATLLETSGTLTRQQSRMLQLLQKGSKNQYGTTPKTWSLDFFRSPTGLTTPTAPGEQPQLTLAHTMLDPSERAVPTGETSTLTTDFVVTSLGHRAEPSLPWYDPALGHIRTVNGRVVDADGRVVRNVYASGWAAMGARGVLASTMMDAYGVADTILRDHFGDEPTTVQGEPEVAADRARDEAAVEVLPRNVELDQIPPEVEAGLKTGKVFDFKTWETAEALEAAKGEQLGKLRERIGFSEAVEAVKEVDGFWKDQ